MPNPWERYAQPKAGPWSKYVVAQTAGTGPKAPTGFAVPGTAPAVAPIPGSDKDINYISAAARAQAEATAGPQAARAIQVNDHSTANEIRANAVKLHQAANAPIPRNQQFDNISGLRKELESQNSVKVYKGALPSYASALRSPETPAGDQDMIYAFAKIMDPNSVVREGEANSVAALGTLGQKIYGELQKQLGEGGKFTPELRAQLRNTLANRVGEYNKAYNFERGRFRDLSTKQGIDPDLVVGPHMGDSVAAIENEYFRHNPNKSAASARAEAANGGNGGTPGQFGGPPVPPTTVATGKTRLENDPAASSIMDTLIRHGASVDEINKSMTQLGFKPVDSKAVIAAQGYLRAHPNYQGSFGLAQREVQQSLLNRVAGSGPGIGVAAAADAGLGGMSDEIAGLVQAPFSDKPLSQLIAEANANKQAAFASSPTAALIGQTVGSIGDMAVGGALLKGGAMAAKLGRLAPYAGNAAFGALEGAGQSNDNRVGGAAMGGGFGLAGTGVGELASVPLNAALRTRPGMAFSNALRDVRGAIPKVGSRFDNSPASYTPSLTPGENDASAAFSKAGADGLRSQLNEAAGLNMPFTLADTSPEVRELVAAGVRRSPTAAKHAEDVLLTRNRGQIDRFGNAVARDLGPVANIPQLSESLAAKAATDAKPLYEQSYQFGQVNDDGINTLLKHPEIKSAYEQGKQIHANDTLIAQARGEAPPPPLVEIQGPDGGFTPPDVRTLDYIKRGLDRKIDAAYTGTDSQAKMNLPFLKDARNLLLDRVDANVPKFAEARSAYGGPMQSRDALEMGQNSLTGDPAQLGLDVSKASPEQLGQMQLGQRSGLMGRANSVRDVSNPWEATLGNPNARARIDAVHPNNPGTDNLFRSLELERGMARTSNDILGNSKTAQRGIADRAFLGPNMDAAVDVGSTVATGGVPVVPLAKLGFAGVKNLLKGETEKRAVAKAEELAPMLLNSDPAASKAVLDDIMTKWGLRKAFEQRQNFTRPAGMFGASLGMASGGY